LKLSARKGKQGADLRTRGTGRKGHPVKDAAKRGVGHVEGRGALVRGNTTEKVLRRRGNRA